MITQFLSIRNNAHNYITMKEFIFGCASYDDVRPSDYHTWTKEEQDALKVQQMAIKPHGEFTSQRQDSFQSSSGFLYVDIDSKENTALDFGKVKSAARELPGLVAAKRSFNDGVALFFALSRLDEVLPEEFAAISHWLRGEVERKLSVVTDPAVCRLGANHIYAADRNPVYNGSVEPITYPESLLDAVSSPSGISLSERSKNGVTARPGAPGGDCRIRSGNPMAIYDEWTDGKWFPKFAEGERHTKLLQFILRHCGLRMNKGKSDTNVYELARAANILGCEPVLKEREADEIAKAAIAYRMGWSAHTPAFRQRQSQRGRRGMESRWRDKPKSDDILRLLGRGLTQKQVAERLGISERTVRRRIKANDQKE